MPTQTLTKPVAQTLLVDAQQQHAGLAQEFSDVQSRLTMMEPGSDQFTVLAHKAADLKAQLQALTAKIQELTLQATTEAEREALAQEAAIAAQVRAELEAQAAIDLAQAEALLETINGHSDGLAAAIAELVNLDGWSRLRQTGLLRLDLSNRSVERLTGEIPYVARAGAVARLRKRYEVPGVR